MRKLLSFALALIMLFGMIPAVHATDVVASGNCGGYYGGETNVTWTLTSDGTLTISGSGDMMHSYEPEAYPWYTYWTSVKTVVMEGNITSGGNYAFDGYLALKTVKIGNGMERIPGGAFDGCRSLTSVELCDGLKEISYSAFYRCTSLKTVTIGSNVEVIGNYAFGYCNNLTAIDIPDSVTTIGDHAFTNCGSLTSIDFGNSVESIGYCAFEACNRLASIDLPDSVLVIGESAFEECTGLTTADLGNSVETVGPNAFAYCSSLISIDFGNSVETISGRAFASCNRLTTIDLPDSVKTIGSEAFVYCDSLTSIDLGNSVETIGFGAFRECGSLTSIKIPDGVTSIGHDAFADCDSLTSINLPDSLLVIGDGAFAECFRLTSIDIPDSVTTIGEKTFYNSGLMTIKVPNSVETIGDSAFELCRSLTSIDIPDSVTTIGETAFYNSGLMTIKVPNSVETIGYCAFGLCRSLTSIDIPDSVTTIGAGAFNRCSSLTTIDLPDSVTTIGERAFYGCTNLTDVYYYGTAAQWENISKTNCEIDADVEIHYMTEKYASNGNRTHAYSAACTDCGAIRRQMASEACADLTGDSKCDKCGFVLGASCNHSNTTSKTVSNGNKTHTTTVTCECGEVISTETSDCIDADKDTYCDVCDAQIVTIKKAVFAGSNMTLGNELEVNFLMTKKNLPTGEYTAVITQKMANGEERITEVAMADWATMGTYHKISARIAAREMADDLYIEIKDAEGYVYNEEYFTSVRGYAGRALAASSTTQYVRVMMIDMLNYGAAAQANFKYKTDDLANNELTAEQQALATAKVECTDNQVKDATVYGSNLSLEDSILLNTFFKGLKGKDIASMYAIVTFTDFEGNAKEIRMEGEEFEKYGSSGDIYKIVVDDVVLADARQLVTVTVYNADGTVFGTGSDSVESYVARAESNNADTYGLYANIMKFATSAYNYIINK